MSKENELIKNLRFLACSTIHNAGSGYIGINLGASPIIFSCFEKLKNSAKYPSFYNRDRFVMCAGHGGVMDYCLRYMLGYNISTEDLRRYRRFGSKLTAFPTLNEELGIDATTGPLGQGFAMAVGMAIAETILAARFNKKDAVIVDHYTYCFVSDGCLMEGITNEAASIAGNFKLNKLIVLYDANNKTIDGDLSLSCKENVLLKFEAMGWQGLEVKNGEDENQICKAIQIAKQSKKPTLIKINTKIGKFSPLEDSSLAHSSSLSDEEYKNTIKNLKVNYSEFEIGNRNKYVLKKIKKQKQNEIEKDIKNLEKYKKIYPDDYEEFLKWNSDYYLKNLANNLKNNDFFIKYEDFYIKSNKNNDLFPTKESFSYIFKKISDLIPNIISLSADVASRVGNIVGNGEVYSTKNRLGRNICCGVREHAMAGICNGIAAHKGLKVFCSSYMVFSDYMKPAMRMSAMMDLDVVYVLSHDSVLIGDDSMTHQPIEHLSTFRSIPNLSLFRPADFNETLGAAICALKDKNPVVISLTKQKVKNNYCPTRIDIENGAYFVCKNKNAKINLIGTGSELEFCFEIGEKLKKEKISYNIISFPCVEKFEKQNEKIKNKIIDKNKYNFIFELSSDLGLNRFCKNGLFFGVNKFTSGGKIDDIKNYIEFNIDDIVAKIKKIIKNKFN